MFTDFFISLLYNKKELLQLQFFNKKITNMILENALQQISQLNSYTTPFEKLAIISHDAIMIDFGSIKKMAVVTDQAWKDMLLLSGLTKKMVAHLNSTISADAGFKLVKEVARRLANNNITLVFNSKGEITRITNGVKNSVSLETIGNILTDLMIKRPSLEVANTFVSNDGTNVEIQVRDTNNQVSFKGMRNEDISLGFTIKTDLFGATSASDFAERLVCTNGMIGLANGKFYDLGADTDDWMQLIQPKDNSMLLATYEENVRTAKNTKLSVREFNQISQHLWSNYKEQASIIAEHMGSGSWKRQYLMANIDTSQLTNKQLANCGTPVNAWNAVNALTYFGSHQHGSDSQMTDTQRLAGKYFQSNYTWDADAQVHNAPKF